MTPVDGRLRILINDLIRSFADFAVDHLIDGSGALSETRRLAKVKSVCEVVEKMPSLTNSDFGICLKRFFSFLFLQTSIINNSLAH